MANNLRNLIKKRLSCICITDRFLHLSNRQSSADHGSAKVTISGLFLF